MTQIAHDTFADTNGTALTAHTSDSGHTWAATPGSAAAFTIDTPGGVGVKGAYGTTVGSTAEVVISRVPDLADYSVSIDVHTASGVTWDFPGVLLRAAGGADTTYRVYLTQGTAGSGFVAASVDKVVAGSQAAIGANTADVAVASGDVIRLTVGISGTTLTVDILNVTTSAALTTETRSDAAISAIGQAGILHQQQTSGPHQVITNFSLDETVGGAAPSFYYLLSQGLI